MSLPDDPLIGFAHAAYRFGERFAARGTGLRFVEARTREELERLLPELDVLVVSGFWRNDLAARAPRLVLIQSISAGTEQFDQATLAARGIRLASAQGANAEAVAQHGMALLLAIARRLPEAIRNQDRRHWRGMSPDPALREDTLAGRTLLVVGYGRIGSRLGALARAFGLRVIGVRRDPGAGGAGADELHGFSALPALWGRADIVALTCALTSETTGLVDEAAFRALKPGAGLVNLARGRVVDETALLDALRSGRLAWAALDVFAEEPLPAEHPLWAMPNVLITPHCAGEFRGYEDGVIDLLVDNIARLRRGETLINQIV
ncbi:D-2-hydroxyacid dehydrogenase [Elioraea thermophila]|uniref:D-2-hydroxyacid dehydrogenase n=1 Tax=Elioraea thermophila TaxID=2185104 RepID=UPI000DF45F7C|nr:D-2-hydroxyacid dehydrogenase [Elioraea thermophila]